MSYWLILAVLGHLANAGVFIIDKSLLTTSFKNSATYAALMGSLSCLMIVAFPWVKAWPTPALYPAIIGFGGLFIIALLGFFEALKRGEASRVVPIVGSLVPVFTLIETTLFLGERLNVRALIGFALLIIATWILTTAGNSKSRLGKTEIMLAVGSSFCFATATVFGKYAFSQADFLGVLISSRLVAGMLGLALGLLVPSARHDIWHMIRGKKEKSAVARPATGWILIGQVSGASGFLLINLALVQGSAAIVNALQAVQYAAISLVAWFGGKRILTLLKEDRSTKTIRIKTLAIVCIAIGLLLITGV